MNALHDIKTSPDGLFPVSFKGFGRQFNIVELDQPLKAIFINFLNEFKILERAQPSEHTYFIFMPLTGITAYIL